MACQNKPPYGWCKGPGSFGAKCKTCLALDTPAKTKGTPVVHGGVGQAIKPATLPLSAHVARPVPKAIQEPLPTTAPTVFAGYTFYRGVGSGPKVYHSRKGFKPRVQIPLAQIRLWMKNLFENERNQLDIPAHASILHKAYKERLDWKPIDVMREIKKEKSASTPQISTDLKPDCGGYDGGSYVFKIHFPSLYVNKRLNSTASADLNPVIAPKLVMNTGRIETSDVFAIACGGNEIAFLTPIPLANIVEYHRPDVDEWRPLWGEGGSSLWESYEDAL